jgi:phosphinothricin acetyltransferase
MIRVATANDLPGIVRIYNQAIRRYSERGEMPVTAFVEPLTVEDRRPWFDRHDAETYPIWVFDTKDSTPNGGEAPGTEVAGWCSLSPYRSGRAALRHVTEVSYYVAEEHQRQGIGAALLAHAVEAAPGLGFHTMIAVLLDINDASIGLIDAHKFELWGRLPEVATFDADRYDHLIYGRHVDPPEPTPDDFA